MLEAEALSSHVVGKEWPDQFVERRLVAARNGCGRQRAHGRSSRNVRGERDLAEVVAGPQDRLGAAALLRDGEHAVEHDVEAVAVVALRDDAGARGNLL